MLHFGFNKHKLRIPHKDLIVAYNKVLLDRIGSKDIIHVSGSTTNIIGVTDTYKCPDDDEYRLYTGWVNGVDHPLYTSTGVPKEITGSDLMDFGVGPSFFVGSKGAVLYSEAMLGIHSEELLRFVDNKNYANIRFLVDPLRNYLIFNNQNLTKET